MARRLWTTNTLPNLPLRFRGARVRALLRRQLLCVPEDIRKQRPWHGNRRDVEALKPEYRLALDRDGYVLVKCEHAVFNAEA